MIVWTQRRLLTAANDHYRDQHDKQTQDHTNTPIEVLLSLDSQ
jgi:hypothetical protein